MPTNDFEENRNFLLSAQPAVIDKEVFNRFIEQFGPDIAKGYCMAFKDLHPMVGLILQTPMNAMKRDMLENLLEKMDVVLHLLSDKGLDKQPNSDANMQAPSI